MRRGDFEFSLPTELIAQEPAPNRDDARLMVVERTRGTRTHARVSELPAFLNPGDLVVVNDTRVIPARVPLRTPKGRRGELLFVRALNTPGSSPPVWLCLGKPARDLQPGVRLTLEPSTEVEIIERQGPGRYVVAWHGHTDVLTFLNCHGQVPLPPYIRRPVGPSAADAERYQTIFARVPGSVAAPTAGLHFTPALVANLLTRGVQLARITLHVGPGTFIPIRVDDVRLHRMEPEWCEIPTETAEAIRAAKLEGKRVVAIGTTTTRALESAAIGEPMFVRSGVLWADRFIVPGYHFQVINALFTNFHLPGSTLILLVAAFAGRELILESYAEAIKHRYRFYSYGDAMLVL
ncbi:MAG: tRNA preQ1(34) S-adenosylmethionine ribosyltransferase-isomerase QueA [Candidatus Binatia bacterium]|nr:tRNA preQ1(34) S-adenosylmethionine ribosyltransferase-isomerase QueA [Candidatus Binatia bacterium]